VGRGAKERGEKRREKRVEMNSNGLNEHWTASEARKKREIAIRKDERMKVLDKAITEYDRLAMEGWNVWKFKEILESLRGEP
jgi:hypothetical protein